MDICRSNKLIRSTPFCFLLCVVNLLVHYKFDIVGTAIEIFILKQVDQCRLGEDPRSTYQATECKSIRSPLSKIAGYECSLSYVVVRMTDVSDSIANAISEHIRSSEIFRQQ